MTLEPQTASEHLDASNCPDSPAASQPASSTSPNANPSIKETTTMTSSSLPALNAAATAVRSSSRYEIGEIVTGKVVHVLKDKQKKDAIPHAVLLSFGSTSGMLRGRDLNGDVDAQRSVMSSVRRGDEFTVMVFDNKGTTAEPKYDLSQSRATNLLAARALVGQTVEGHVVNVAKYGAFIDIGNDRSGLLHVSEMGSNNQERRRSQLKKGMSVSVSILAVEPDPANPAKLRFEFSEVEAELKKAAELVGSRVTATITGPCKAGLRLVLKSGVEATLAYENFNSLDYKGLKVGGNLNLKVLGIVGRALSVAFEK